MPSKTSNFEPDSTTSPVRYPKYFSKAMFLQTVDSLLPIPIIYFLVVFLAIPMNIFMLEEGATEVEGFFWDFAQYVSYVRTYGLSLSLLLGCLSALLVFRYLFNNRATNMVHSLPIPRPALFWTQYLAGLSFMVVPNILLLMLTFLACALQGFFFPEPLWYMFWIQNALYFFFYSFAVFCAMFTGSPGAVAIYYLIFNFLVAFVTVLLDPIFEMYYVGYTGDILSYPYVQILTPVFALAFAGKVTLEVNAPYSSVGGLGTSADPLPEQILFLMDDVNLLWGYIAVAVVMVLVGLVVYLRRHLEYAGEAVSVPVLKPVFRCCLAVLGGIAMGIVTLFLITEDYDSDYATSILPLYSVLWGLVFGFVAEMILQKSFRVLHSWKKNLLPMGSIAVIFVVMWADLTGFESYIPKESKVSQVWMVASELYPRDSATPNNYEYGDNGFVSSEEFALISDLHLSVVDAAREYKKTLEVPEGHRSMSLSLQYYLDSGYITQRGFDFTVPYEQENYNALAEQYLDFFATKERLEESYNLSAMEAGTVDEITFNAVYNEKQDIFDIVTLSQLFDEASGSELREMQSALVSALAKDFEEGNIGEKFLSQADPRLLQDFYYGDIQVTWRRTSSTSTTEENLSSDGTLTSTSEQGDSSAQTLAPSRNSPQLQTNIAIGKDAVHTLAVLKEYHILEDYSYLTYWSVLEQCQTWYLSTDALDMDKIPNSRHFSRADVKEAEDPMSFLPALG